MIYLYENIYILLLFALLYFEYRRNMINSIKSSSGNDFIVYNKYYLELLNEAYNKNPDIEREVKCILNYYRNKSIPTFYLIDGIRIYGKSIRMLNITDKLRFNDGDIGSHYYQMKHYNKLINSVDKKSSIKNICEIGFQLGVGAITLITSVKHDVKYYGFDYGKKYSKNAFNILSKYFPMKMMWGESQRTVPYFYKNNNNFDKCDIIHIDGCHSQDAIYNDIVNIKEISHPKSLLLLDDVYINSESIKKAKKNNLINKIICYNWKPYCIAEYT